jgi:hypothetical protein
MSQQLSKPLQTAAEWQPVFRSVTCNQIAFVPRVSPRHRLFVGHLCAIPCVVAGTFLFCATGQNVRCTKVRSARHFSLETCICHMKRTLAKLRAPVQTSLFQTRQVCYTCKSFVANARTQTVCTLQPGPRLVRACGEDIRTTLAL